MTTPDQARAIFLTMPVVEEETLIGHTGYRLNTKLFGTVWPNVGFATLRVGKEEQVMLLADARIFSLPQTGIKGGWVSVKLAAIGEEDFRALVWKAWHNTAPPRLSLQY